MQEPLGGCSIFDGGGKGQRPPLAGRSHRLRRLGLGQGLASKRISDALARCGLWVGLSPTRQQPTVDWSFTSSGLRWLGRLFIYSDALDKAPVNMNVLPIFARTSWTNLGSFLGGKSDSTRCSLQQRCAGGRLKYPKPRDVA